MDKTDLAPATSMTTVGAAAEAPVPWLDDFDFDHATAGAQPRRRRWLRWLAVPIAIVVVIGAILWFAKPFAATTASLVTAQSTTGTIVSSVSLSGSVASSSINELTFDAAGTVTAVNVAVGDTVTAGEVLATIDDSALQVQIATATTSRRRRPSSPSMRPVRTRRRSPRPRIRSSRRTSS